MIKFKRTLCILIATISFVAINFSQVLAEEVSVENRNQEVIDTLSEAKLNDENDSESSESYQVFEGKFDSESDIKTYTISIDFSNISTAAICLVKTGKSNINMKITDEEGNSITKKPIIATTNVNARR